MTTIDHVSTTTKLEGLALRNTARHQTADWLSLVAGLGLGVALAATLVTQSRPQTGGMWVTLLSQYAAVAGTYASLVCVVIVARLPWLERHVGQDQLIVWHRRLGPWALWMIALHVILVVAGYASLSNTSVLGQAWDLLTGTRWILPATAGFLLMVMAGVTSYRVARKRMKYETWWVVHLYFYLAIALSFAHQVTLGAPFLSGWAKYYWISLYVLTLGTVLAFRVAMPLLATIRHQIRVYAVIEEGPGIVSVWLKGRKLDKLGAHGGQFFNWRFLTGDMKWQAHPYSLSAPAQREYLRITVKDLGDHSSWLARVRPGTRVAIEGPYGTFTAQDRRTNSVVLIGGGVGITPIRALAEELGPEVSADIIYRASSPADAVLSHELDALAQRRAPRVGTTGPGVRVHYLIGAREPNMLSPTGLRSLVPHISSADVYVCGPESLTRRVIDSCAQLGIPSSRIHREEFNL